MTSRREASSRFRSAAEWCQASSGAPATDRRRGRASEAARMQHSTSRPCRRPAPFHRLGGVLYGGAAGRRLAHGDERRRCPCRRGLLRSHATSRSNALPVTRVRMTRPAAACSTSCAAARRALRRRTGSGRRLQAAVVRGLVDAGVLRAGAAARPTRNIPAPDWRLPGPSFRPNRRRRAELLRWQDRCSQLQHDAAGRRHRLRQDGGLFRRHRRRPRPAGKCWSCCRK